MYYLIRCPIKYDFEVWQRNTCNRKIYHRKTICKPAVKYSDGRNAYFYDGIAYKIVYSPDSKEIIATVQNKEILQSFNNHPSRIYYNGTKEWHTVGFLNRQLFPAVIYSNGDQEYWNFGKRNRYNGPAVIYGNKQYFFENGEFIKCIV